MRKIWTQVRNPHRGISRECVYNAWVVSTIRFCANFSKQDRRKAGTRAMERDRVQVTSFPSNTDSLTTNRHHD